MHGSVQWISRIHQTHPPNGQSVRGSRARYQCAKLLILGAPVARTAFVIGAARAPCTAYRRCANAVAVVCALHARIRSLQQRLSLGARIPQLQM